MAFIRATRARGSLDGHRGDRRLRPRLAVALAIAAPLAAFLPFGIEASAGRTFAWDARLSRALDAYRSRQTLNRHVDVFGLVLHPAVQALGIIIVCAGVLSLLARQRLDAALFLGASVGGAVVGAPLLKELFATPPSVRTPPRIPFRADTRCGR